MRVHSKRKRIWSVGVLSKSTDKKIIKYVEFLATKFDSDHKPWVYSRNTGDLVHIRYRSDYTGYNHWTKRFKRAFDWKHLTGTDSLSRMISGDKKYPLKMRFLHAAAWIRVSLRKDRNLPDGQVNGILTSWEENGEYITMMCPTVGVEVLNFLKAEPDNEHAKAILREMHRAYDASFGKEDVNG